MHDYLLVQAVNLGQVIDDSQDISTRRAGGYMLLDLIHRIADVCKGALTPASLGASEGLFAVNEGAVLEEVRQAIDRVLAEPLFAQATVLVCDTKTAGIQAKDFPEARERLAATLRLRQMQTPSMSLVFGRQDSSRPPLQPVCRVDRVRPAVTQDKDAGSMSLSVTLRRQEGRALRQKFYRRELQYWSQDAADFSAEERFTRDLAQLTQFGAAERAALSPLLEGKMALLYADGNGFGKTKQGCRSVAASQAWDQAVQNGRREYLHSLLQMLKAHPLGVAPKAPDAPFNSPPPIRLETLMWGGDEFCLVLPAWLALEAADLFFRTCRIEYPAGQRQTHSASLVFAHHNAPIGSLQSLASRLADQGKRGLGAGQDSLHWIVLESFDHAGGDLGAYWATRHAPGVDWAKMALNGESLARLLKGWPAVAQSLPTRSLYRIMDGLRHWKGLNPNEQRLVCRAYDNVHKALPTESRADWAQLWTTLLRTGGGGQVWPDPMTDSFVDPSHLNAWLTLTELADYLPQPVGAAA